MFKDVVQFLEENKFLLPLIEEAEQKVFSIFGQNQDIRLDLLDNKLYLVIYTELSVKEAMELEKKLDEEWWLSNIHRANGKFNIIVEYV